MNKGFSKITKMLDDGVSKESLFDELMHWLADDVINEFADDYKRLYS